MHMPCCGAATYFRSSRLEQGLSGHVTKKWVPKKSIFLEDGFSERVRVSIRKHLVNQGLVLKQIPRKVPAQLFS
jgi:hypothetical protein